MKFIHNACAIMYPWLHIYLVGGFNPSEKYESVSWDDDIPNIWKVKKIMFQTTSQMVNGY